MEVSIFFPQSVERRCLLNADQSKLNSLFSCGSSYSTSMAPSFPSGEPTVEAAASDWRTQLSFDARSRIVNKMSFFLSYLGVFFLSAKFSFLLVCYTCHSCRMETLKNHLPFTGPEGLTEVRRIATRFEENVFSAASGQTDYLRKISTKLFAMETKSQNAVGSSSSTPAANNGTSMDSGHLMDNNNSRPFLPNTSDWRAQLPPDSHHRNVDKIREALNKHVPNCGQEGINELMRIAGSFEELIFNTAINQVDYFRKVSFKLQTMV